MGISWTERSEKLGGPCEGVAGGAAGSEWRETGGGADEAIGGERRDGVVARPGYALTEIVQLRGGVASGVARGGDAVRVIDSRTSRMAWMPRQSGSLGFQGEPCLYDGGTLADRCRRIGARDVMEVFAMGARRRSGIGWAICLAVLLAMAPVDFGRPTASGAVAGPVGEFAEAACPFGLPEGLVEGVDITCGYLTVPERHELPDGPVIRLAVAVLGPTGAGDSGPPLVMLNGGPGQGSDALLPVFAPGAEGVLAGMRDGRTVVLLDQRGTGRSEPALFCTGDTVDAPALESPATAATPAVAMPKDLDGQIAFYRTCLDGWAAQGIDLGAYTSEQNAADVATLRTALGYDEIDLLGVSYGSRLALTVMRDHPEGIRSVVMASVVPVEADLYAGQIPAFDATLRATFAGCAADPACAGLLPDPEGTLLGLLERLDATPMAVTYQPLTGGEPVEIEVDGAMFLRAIYAASYIGPFVGAIPVLIALTDAGATDGLGIILPVMELMNGGIASGMLLAVTCQDEAAFSSIDAIDATARAAEVLAPLQTTEFYETSGAALQFICPELDLGASPAIENEPVTSDIPTLLISGEFDPITPPIYGEQVAGTLTNATHVVITGVSHDPISTSPDCAVQMVDSFLDDPLAAVDDACADDLVTDFSPGF